MSSNEDPRNADWAPRERDQGSFTHPSPSPKGNRPWLIWAIAGATTVLVVVAVAVAVVNLRKEDGGTAGGAGSVIVSALTSNTTPQQPAIPAQPTPAQDSAAVDELRSHMPVELRSLPECQETEALDNALAAIGCDLSSSAVPNAAMYNLYLDVDSMNVDAKELHKGDNPAQYCESADDFTTGGRTTWSNDEGRSGTLWCYLNESSEPVLLWTEDTLHILTFATAPALSDLDELIEWWSSAGPV